MPTRFPHLFLNNQDVYTIRVDVEEELPKEEKLKSIPWWIFLVLLIILIVVMEQM